jgi:TetR/AcrR family tetracycline transcriptional repressor
MRHHRADVVARALDILSEFGLPDLTMRRLGTELGVQPSAIYHHFASKQALLGAVADEIIARGPRESTADEAPWDVQVRARCAEVREAVLTYQDGADVVATMWAFGLGGQAPYDGLTKVLERGGLEPVLARTAARTLLHFVYGHAMDEQVHAQATRLGATAMPPRGDGDFEAGLAIVVAGIAAGKEGAAFRGEVRDGFVAPEIEPTRTGPRGR